MRPRNPTAAAFASAREHGRLMQKGVVRAMLPYNGGAFTAFLSDDRGPRCGGAGDLVCNLVQVIGVGVEQLRQAGRDIDQTSPP
jgi:hypothetical protein